MVVSLVLVSLGKVDSVTLCIGRDGHIALENTETGVCDYTLAKLAKQMGLPMAHDRVQAEATCCPCSDVPLPGKSLDYQRLPAGEILFVETPVQVDFALEMSDDPAGCPVSDELIPHPPPPEDGCTAVRDALSSIVILA